MHQFQRKIMSFITASFLVVFKLNHSFFFTQKLDVLTKTKASSKIKRTLSLLLFKNYSNKKTFQVFQLNENHTDSNSITQGMYMKEIKLSA